MKKRERDMDFERRVADRRRCRAAWDRWIAGATPTRGAAAWLTEYGHVLFAAGWEAKRDDAPGGEGAAQGGSNA